MSTRDHGLLNAAGLSVTDAAALFSKTRQAIYSGMSSATEDKPYFSAYDAIIILQDAKRRDAPMDELIKFIRANYPESENLLVLSDSVGYEQIGRVVSDADEVLLAFNGNLDQLNPNSSFAKVLTDLVGANRGTRFVVPGEWAVRYVKQYLKLELPTYEVRDDITYLPSFVVIEKHGAYRAFFFLRLSAEEMHPNEAVRLGMHFAPTSQENSPRRSAGAA